MNVLIASLVVVVVVSILCTSFAQEGDHTHKSTLQLNSNDVAPTGFGKADMLRHCGTYCDGSRAVKKFLGCILEVPTCLRCYCDDFCKHYGDCCPDIDGNLKFTQPSTLACVDIVEDDHKTSYLMKTTCYIEDKPSIGDIDVDKTSPEPVTSNITGIVYFNKWYARCNYDLMFTPWMRMTICREQVIGKAEADLGDNMTDSSSNWNEKSTKKSVTCYKSFTSPPELRTSLRKCYKAKAYNPSGMVSTCNVTGQWLNYNKETEHLCLTEYFPVKENETLFRNVYCYVCNGYRPKRKRCEKSSYRKVITQYDIIDIIRWDVKPALHPKSLQNCTDSGWLDNVTDTCRWLSCPPGRYLLDGECVDTEHNITEIEYWFEAAFTLPTINGSKENTDESLENRVLEKLVRLFLEKPVKLFIVQMEIYIDQSTKVETLGIHCGFWVFSHFNRTVFETLTNTLFQHWYLYINHKMASMRPVFYNRMDVKASSIYRELVYILDPVTRNCCRPLNELTEIPVDILNVRKTKVVLTYVPYCTYVRLNQTEFTLTDGVASLSYTPVKLTNGSYIIQQSDLLICRDLLIDIYQSMTSEPEPNIEGILSLVCTSISLFCLALTFITFCTFQELRTLPTKNNMFLVMSLFLAQGLLQFSPLFTFDSTVCSILGVIIHFLWLTVLLWMNVCSFHMLYIFVISKTLHIDQNYQGRLLRKYVVYVYSLATTIVVVNIIVHVSVGAGLGYGGPFCYLSSGIAILVSFVIPMVLILLANIAFFIKTMVSISNVKEMKREGGSDRNNILIYLKLSSLTGIVWLVAILSVAMRNTPLKFIAIVLSASQGVFIFFSYVVNYRTLKLWTSLCGLPMKEYPSTSMATKSSTV